MYAIIKTSGRQYKVEPGMMIEMNRLNAEPGEVVTLDDSVLMVKNEDDVNIGEPIVPGAKVELKVVEHYRGKKLIVFKMKRRKRYRVKKGHRQELTKVEVVDVKLA